jgi:hypothetical protein
MSRHTPNTMREADWFSKRADRLRNRLISKHRTTIPLAGEARAFIQKQMELTRTGVRKGHSHASAASERNSATETMLAVVSKRGFEPYVISPSMREKDVDGIRTFHSLADLRQDYKASKLTKNHMIVMTDVDYYVDMHEIISYGVPILCYTFQPRAVSGTVKDGFFTIENNIIHYRVNGGKDVRHRTWNYNQDTVFTIDPVLGFWPSVRNYVGKKTGYTKACRQTAKQFGIAPGGRRITIATIDQFELSEHRNIVSIVPFARCKSNLLPICDFGVMLEQTVYQQPGSVTPSMNAITYISDEGPVVSLGEEGQFASVTIPLNTFECTRTAFSLSKTNNLSDTVRRLQINHHDAAIVHKYLVNGSGMSPVEVHKPGQLARHYQTANPEHDLDPTEQGKEYAHEYAPGPLTQTAVFPSVSVSNERATIEGRIVKPQQKAKSTVSINSNTKKFAREFIAVLVPKGEMKKGTPYSVAYVEEQQQKPLQRARNDANRMHDAFTMVTKAFQKKEAYNAPNHPRNISTVPHAQNVKLSGFTYAFKDGFLKRQNWYMPCHTPSEIAEAVHNLAIASDELVETDYSRFDGTFLEFMRENVEFAAYRRWCSPDHLVELNQLLANEVNSKAVTRLGLKYRPGFSRLSGSALTTDGNSIANAFVSFMANRLSGQDVPVAWSNIGLVYGDDGLRNGTAPDATLMSAASSLGFQLKIINRASSGNKVSFLSRIYADPWSSPASVQTPSRTLLKLHTSCDTNEDIEAIGWAKTQAYLVTDGLTPFISHWCKAYQRNCTSKIVNYNDFSDIPFWVRDENSLSNSWPQSDSEIWLDVVADDLGVSVAELSEHIAKLDNYTGPVAGLPRLTTNMNQDPKLDVVMDGEVIAGPITNEDNKDGPNPSSDQPKPERAEEAVSGVSGPTQKPGRAKRSRRQRKHDLRDQCQRIDKEDARPGKQDRRPERGQPTSEGRPAKQANKPARRRSTAKVGGQKKTKQK